MFIYVIEYSFVFNLANQRLIHLSKDKCIYSSTFHASFTRSSRFTNRNSVFLRAPRKIVKGNIHIFVFSDFENNGFEKKLITQNTNI